MTEHAYRLTASTTDDNVELYFCCFATSVLALMSIARGGNPHARDTALMKARIAAYGHWLVLQRFTDVQYK